MMNREKYDTYDFVKIYVYAQSCCYV